MRPANARELAAGAEAYTLGGVAGLKVQLSIWVADEVPDGHVPTVCDGEAEAVAWDVSRAILSARHQAAMARTQRAAPEVSVVVFTTDIARVCHEANRALQLALGEDNPSPHWDDAPEWERESAVAGVDQAIAGATPEQLHQSWYEFKQDHGWSYGEVKDGEAKTHPCLVPYAELPADQRLKDELFAAIVGALS